MYIMSPNAISRFVGCYYIRVDMRYLLYKYQELIVVEFVYEIYFIEHLYTRWWAMQKDPLKTSILSKRSVRSLAMPAV